ncbi:MAG TPA: helix-turn-helix transcriptional regulator [Thermoanaerobaculia bacterium]|nr:helix-turn-helix transcriptional regulator [Thermoanaerobaculia bacterium]
MSEDLRQLRAVLRQAIGACGMSARNIETAMGIGHGALERILDGRNDLRVRHILALARLLKVPPQDFLELGVLQPEAGTKYRLKDWIMPREMAPPNAAKKPDQPANEVAKLVREAVQQALGTELKEAVRDAVRDELDGKDSKTKR